jgi:hypothetical protein
LRRTADASPRRRRCAARRLNQSCHCSTTPARRTVCALSQVDRSQQGEANAASTVAFSCRTTTTPPTCAQPLASTRLGVAPGMGRKLKVKVLLETRQTESNTEDKGGPVRGRLVEVVGAARNRAKAKHRKARVSWVSQPPVAKPVVCQTASCIGDGVRVKLSVLTRGDLPASVGNHGSR